MGTFKGRYELAKKRLLTEPTICRENRDVFRRFFEHEEYKLQRQNDLRQLDESCYKTLYVYIYRFRKVNSWFGGKPWTELTREDIKAVYDGLEDGKILNQKGQPFRSTEHYYNKVLKSKPFELAGKAQLARDVIQFPKRRRRSVRYVTSDGFRQLVSVLTKPQHLLLFWLAWDIGENIDALLQLQKKQFARSTDPHTKEPEYLVNLPEAKIKRSRQTRTEPTLYPETVRYCDMVLPQLADDDHVFAFGYRQALKLIHNAGWKSGVTCLPDGERIRWKDLRSGMACHLLSMGWQPHEVNIRLGHTPNSDRLNDYINYLAIDRHRPKRKLYQSQLQSLQEELRESRERERLSRVNVLRHTEKKDVSGAENQSMRAELAEAKVRVEELAEMVRTVLARLPAAEEAFHVGRVAQG